MSFCFHVIGQQQNQITQFAYNKLAFNPANAGDKEYPSFQILHRNQWAGLAGAPNTQLLSVNLPFRRQNIGMGIFIKRSAITIQEKLDVSTAYAYRLNFKSGYASIGMALSARRFVNDFTDERLIAIDGFALDPSIERIKYSSTIFNLGLGTYVKTGKFSFGISTPRILKSKIDDDDSGLISREIRHFYAFASMDLNLNTDWQFKPQLLYKYADKIPSDLELWLEFIYKNQFHFASNLRTGGAIGSTFESLDLVLGLKLKERLFVSMAFDFTLTEIKNFENGSFEILLRYDLIPSKIPLTIQNPRYY